MSDVRIYTVGGPVQARGGRYIERQADTELFELCREGEYAYILTSRQMGKSSLMIRTAERLVAIGVRAVQVDLNIIGTEQISADQWYLGLLVYIAEELNLAADVVGWWQERAHLSPTYRLNDFFANVLLAEIPGQVVVFIDEVEATIPLEFASDFFAVIRTLYMGRAVNPTYGRLSFVLIGVATPEELIRSSQRTQYNIGHRVELSDFSWDEALPLAQGLGLPPEQAEATLASALDWTAGHPYLTQQLCHALAVHPSRPSELEAAAPEGADFALQDVIPQWVRGVVAQTFFGDRSEKDPNLLFVRDALLQRSRDRVETLRLYLAIRQGRQVLDEEQSQAKADLKLSGIVRRRQQRLEVSNRIYAHVFDAAWASQHLPRNLSRILLQVASGLIIALVVALALLAPFAFYQQSLASQQASAAETARADEQNARIIAQTSQSQAEQARGTSEALRLEADRNKDLANARLLLAEGPNVVDPELRVLLMLEALKLDDGPLMQAMFREGLQGFEPRINFSGHTDWALNLTMTDSYLISAGQDSTARIWNAQSGSEAQQVNLCKEARSCNPDIPEQAARYPVLDAALSPDLRYLATASTTSTVRLWRLSPRPQKWPNPIPLWSEDRAATSVAFSPTSEYLAIGNLDGTITIRDLAMRSTISLPVEGGQGLQDMAFSPDGKWLATAGQDGILLIWSVLDWSLARRLNGHTAEILTVDYDDSGSYLLTADVDGIIILRDATSGAIIQQRDLGQQKAGWGRAALSPDGQRIAVSSSDGFVRVFDVTSGELSLEVGGTQGGVSAVVWGSDAFGDFVAASGQDRQVRKHYLAFTDVVAVAESRVTRELKPEELITFLQALDYGDVATTAPLESTPGGTDTSTPTLTPSQTDVEVIGVRAGYSYTGRVTSERGVAITTLLEEPAVTANPTGQLQSGDRVALLRTDVTDWYQVRIVSSEVSDRVGVIGWIERWAVDNVNVPPTPTPTFQIPSSNTPTRTPIPPTATPRRPLRTPTPAVRIFGLGEVRDYSGTGNSGAFNSCVSGQVIDRNGRGIDAAVVEVNNGPVNRYQATTGGGGFYKICGLGASNWAAVLFFVPGSPPLGNNPVRSVYVNGSAEHQAIVNFVEQ